MAIRPEISLAARGPAVDTFSNALEKLHSFQDRPLKNRLMEAQAGQAEAGLEQTTQLNRIRDIAIFTGSLAGDLAKGDLQSIRAKLTERAARDLPNRGLPNNDTLEAIDVIDDPNLSDEQKIAHLTESAQLADQLAVRTGALPGTAAAKDFTLSKDQIRFGAGGKEIARGATSTDPTQAQIPHSLIKDLPVDAQKVVSDVFTAAGGGSKGLDAANKQIEISRKATQIEDIPQILNDTFPSASTAERAEIDAAMQAAKTVEGGLKTANKIRTEQRRLKDAKVFQQRAIDLLGKVLDNPELNDVVGPIEGRIDAIGLISDSEANAIADIQELESILTADNLKLMTGVLSESDIKLLIRLSSGATNRTRSEKRFREDVNELKTRLSSQLVQTVDDKAVVRVKF